MIFKSGKYKDFEELYQDNKKMVYVFIRDYETDSDQVLDLSQQLWYKAFLNRDKFQEKTKKEVRHYLRTMVRNMMMDHFTQQQKERELAEAFTYLYGKEEVTYLEEELELFLEAAPEEYLDQAMGILSEEERSLLDWKYEMNMKSEDMAALLDITDALVRMRLRRIRLRLKEEAERLMKENSEDER